MDVMENKKRIFFIEPQNLIRVALVSLVRAQPQLEVVGDAEGNTNAVIEMIIREAPDVVIMAAELISPPSFEIVKSVRKTFDSVNFLALAETRDKWLFRRLLKAGCRGYLLKDATENQFLDAIKAISKGTTYISQDMVDSLLGFAIDGTGKDKSNTELSEREREIMKLLAAGYSSTEIGRQVNLSSKTIDTYRARILAKLNLRTKADLVRYGIQNGFVDYLWATDSPH